MREEAGKQSDRQTERQRIGKWSKRHERQERKEEAREKKRRQREERGGKEMRKRQHPCVAHSPLVTSECGIKKGINECFLAFSYPGVWCLGCRSCISNRKSTLACVCVGECTAQLWECGFF